MEMTKAQAGNLLSDCSTDTLVIGGEEGEELNVNNKLGAVLLSHGITPYRLVYKHDKENMCRAGQFLKEWGELLLSEEKKSDVKIRQGADDNTF